MNVLLRSTVKGLGRSGEIVAVSDAYARNFLFPKKFAVLATGEVLKIQKNIAGQTIKHRAELAAGVQQLAERLRSETVIVTAKANSQGKLFAAVKIPEIQRMVEQKSNVHLGAMQMKPDHLKMIGQHSVMLTVATIDIPMTVEIRHG